MQLDMQLRTNAAVAISTSFTQTIHTINRQTWRTYVRDGECTSGLYRPCEFLFLL